MPQLHLAPAPSFEVPVIVVGSDLTPGSDGALAYALGLAPRLGAKILLLHVVQHLALKRPRSSPIVRRKMLTLRQVVDSERDSAQRQLKRQLARVTTSKPQVTFEVRSGLPFYELLAAAHKKSAGLLVLGTADQSAGLGRVAQRVLRAARIPVVIVPPTIAALPKTRPKARLRLVPKLKRAQAPRSR